MSFLKKLFNFYPIGPFCEECGKVVYMGKVEYISFFKQKYWCSSHSNGGEGK